MCEPPAAQVALELALDVAREAVLARDITETIRNSVTFDWAMTETVKASLRRLVRWKLRKYEYPPDKAVQAVNAVLKQAEMLAADWAG